MLKVNKCDKKYFIKTLRYASFRWKTRCDKRSVRFHSELVSEFNSDKRKYFEVLKYKFVILGKIAVSSTAMTKVLEYLSFRTLARHYVRFFLKIHSFKQKNITKNFECVPIFKVAIF